MSALDTLFYVLKNGSFVSQGQKSVFLNARYHDDLSLFDKDDITIYQVFKPYVEDLEARGFNASDDFSEPKDLDLAILDVPKNSIESQYLIAHGLQNLRVGGMFICAAENKAGGTRLKKILESFGLGNVQHESRNKARCVWAYVETLNNDAIEKALAVGVQQSVLDDQFVSQAGIYGWNKVDKGSEILTRYIPNDLKGHGADFGCGYGYLSRYVLEECPKVKSLICVDADYRAVDCCTRNLTRFDVPKEFVWQDLTKPIKTPRSLQFIVMNPPFHEGRNADVGIGKKFIETAYAALGRNGRLWVVANNHLAYEDILSARFFDVKKHHEGQGFKVFEAIK